jgi:UDP:flavonoid glycosyltransferase YjiC (YdhE family)
VVLDRLRAQERGRGGLAGGHPTREQPRDLELLRRDLVERARVACDLAIVHGGLTTSMELVAHGTPFLYFPLRHHFEQNFHVRHRLEGYGARRCMDYDAATPAVIAAAIAQEIGREVATAPSRPTAPPGRQRSSPT